MNKVKHWSLAFGTLAAVLVVVACQDAASPTPSPGGITAAAKPPKDCPNYRLTGGGRTDDQSHVTAEKSTPESHDFATFGFQARPSGDCAFGGGSGQQQWNEHNPNAVGGGFAFHGRVTFFTVPHDGSPPEQCGRYGGSGRFNPRNGLTSDGVPFEVFHACDVGEPGVGRDHIYIQIGPIPPFGDFYERHGLLSGGNIQWHRMTGNQ
jgi:hypothetical protein